MYGEKAVAVYNARRVRERRSSRILCPDEVLYLEVCLELLTS